MSTILMSTIQDAQIAADMALAAMDNRASWDALDEAQRTARLIAQRFAAIGGEPQFGAVTVQPHAETGAPRLLAARATYQAGYPVWVEED